MTEPVDAVDVIGPPEALDREKALTLAALAAKAWCERRAAASSPPGGEVVERLMIAASWVSRARRHHGLAALGLSELLAVLDDPVAHWLPGAPEVSLIEDRDPSPFCWDLVDDAGSSALAEVEQGVVEVAMQHLLGRPDEAAAYTAFRRFLVEHAHAEHPAAAAAVQEVGLTLARVYQHVPEAAVVSHAGVRVFYPCPRCRWPMRVRGALVSCHRSPACLTAGARFDRTHDHLVGLGALAPPEPLKAQGTASLLPGVWRYTVLPGLEELELERRLRAIEGVTVELWPFVDAYDLDVRRAGHHWRIDVKDHSSALSLARHLAERPRREPTWIVVPDARAQQVRVLQQRVPAEAGYHFATASQLVQRVRGGW